MSLNFSAHAESLTSETILNVYKGATLCVSPTNCGYTNPSHQMSCEFKANGTVAVSGRSVGGLMGPVVEEPQRILSLTLADRARLNDLLSQTVPSSQMNEGPGRTLHWGPLVYAPGDIYRVVQGASSFELATYFLSYSRLMAGATTASLVQLVDPYCVWMP